MSLNMKVYLGIIVLTYVNVDPETPDDPDQEHTEVTANGEEDQQPPENQGKYDYLFFCNVSANPNTIFLNIIFHILILSMILAAEHQMLWKLASANAARHEGFCYRISFQVLSVLLYCNMH